jgi:hypothetical protein
MIPRTARSLLVASLALAMCLTRPELVAAQTDPLPSWNDGPAKQAIVKLVEVNYPFGPK